jgi:TetR/AcrR family transcriptional repressor of lmrAB and yxaGH operons
MPAALLSKDEVLARLLTVLRRDGFDGASLSSLSAATGLGKSSLYHYFPDGKEDMAAAVLKHLEVTVDASILTPLRAPGDPAGRLRTMLRAVDEFYQGGREPCLLAALGMGESAKRFHPRVARVFAHWVDAIAVTLRDAGETPARAKRRAEDAIVRIEGALVLARGMGEPALFARTLRALSDDLTAT